MKAKTWHSPAGESFRLYKDMLAQPHLMIAGAAGSGKSVVINALIYTALYKFPMDHENGAQFILIDPKRVELVSYKDLPHTLYYASESETILSALQYAMDITESRYKAMQRAGERKYSGGHVYVIIDEFADLMTTDRRHVQPLVQRLSQIGRAANVHVFLCTQRPTTDIIPGSITANFDARVGLHTAKAQHSQNIIGQNGCETLPRYGQGYYINPEGCTLYYIHMIEKEEITARIKWWTDQKKTAGLFARLFRKK